MTMFSYFKFHVLLSPGCQLIHNCMIALAESLHYKFWIQNHLLFLSWSHAVTFNHLMLPTVTMRMWLLIISLITMWLLITTWLPCVCDYWLYYWLPHDYHVLYHM